MGMYIAIARGIGWSGSSGVFDCIVEGTRTKFLDINRSCMDSIYTTLDDQGQSFIALDEVGAVCFNIFYRLSEKAMDEFADSERGRTIPQDHVPGILWHWSEVLRMMRDDPRFTPDAL